MAACGHFRVRRWAVLIGRERAFPCPPVGIFSCPPTAVDVPRDFWGEHQWPFENWVQEAKDKKLVRENAPMIELMWNLTWVQIPRLREGDLSQPPDPWYRLEHAIYGYVELVRNREQGKIEFREGERDRKSQKEAVKDFADFYRRANVPVPPHLLAAVENAVQ
jgi:hypothetical protein